MMKMLILRMLGMALVAPPMATPVHAQAPDTSPRIASAPGVRLDAAYLVGMWSDNESCSGVIDFRRDGTFVNPDGSSGRWQIAGDVVTLSGQRVIVIRLAPRSRTETVVVQADGFLGYSRRCLGPMNPARDR